MTAARIELDFIKQRRGVSLPGVVLFVLGAAAIYWAVADYQAAVLESELLDIRIAGLTPDRSVARAEFDPETSDQIRAATLRLSTPWSALLDDLEQATADSGKEVALLQVAPDLDKREVSIVAETRSLGAALAYVERLQGAAALRFPTLESHEVRVADRQRPVRVEITAEWGLR